jgi:hypothetical protein
MLNRKELDELFDEMKRKTNPKKASEPNRSLKEPIDSIVSYSQSILRGSGKGLGDIYNTVRHPVDQFLTPISTLIYDSAIIYAAHTPPNLVAPEDFVTLNHYALQNQPIYDEAVSRMQARMYQMKTLGHLFVEGDGPKRAELLAESMTSMFVPGYLLKGVSSASKMALNAKTFGFVSSPPLFHNLYPGDVLKGLPKIDLFSPEKIKKSLGEGHYLYVYTSDKKLLVAERVLESPIVRNNGVTSPYLHHSDLASGKPVFTAGELYTHNGHIKSLTDMSGHYLPTGPNLGTFTEKLFYDNGYLDAKGAFKHASLLGKIYNNPIMTHEGFNFNLVPGKETLAFSTAVGAISTAKTKQAITPSENSLPNLGDLSPHIKQTIVTADTIETLLERFDPKTRETIKVFGTNSDKALLDDIEVIENYQSQYKPRNAQHQSMLQRVELAYRFQDAGSILGQFGQLAGRLGNPGLNRAFNIAGSAASFASGALMFAANPIAGLGMMLSGANGLLSCFDDSDEDNSAQILFDAIEQVRTEFYEFKQDLIKYLIQTHQEMFDFWIRGLSGLFSELNLVQHMIQQQGHKLNANDAITHSALNILVKQAHQETLLSAANYGKNRALPIEKLTEAKYYELMPKLYQLTEEASADYHNGLTIYKAECQDGSKAVINEINSLHATGRYAYELAQFDDLRQQASQVFNPRIWIDSTEHYLRLRKISSYQYDEQCKEIQKIIDQGDIFLEHMNSLEPRSFDLFVYYYNHAANAMIDIEFLLTKSETVLQIADQSSRQREVQKLLALIQSDMAKWEERLIINLIKAQQLCLVLGIKPLICTSIPILGISEAELSLPLKNNLNQASNNLLQFPKINTLKAELNRFEKALNTTYFQTIDLFNGKANVIFFNPTVATVFRLVRLLKEYKEEQLAKPTPATSKNTSQPEIKSSDAPSIETLMSVIQELVHSQNTLTQEVQALRKQVGDQQKQRLNDLMEKPAIQWSNMGVEAIDSDDISKVLTSWLCETKAKLPDEATCFNPQGGDGYFLLRRLVSKPWAELSSAVNECSMQNGVKYCSGDEIEYIEYPAKQSEYNTQCALNVLGSSAIHGALFAAVPEAIGDLFYLYGKTSPTRAEEIKWFINLSLMLLLGSSLKGYILGIAVSLITVNTLKKAGLSESSARIAGNTAGFFVNHHRQLTTPLGIAATVTSLTSGRLGLWAEKRLISLLQKPTEQPESKNISI